MTDYASLETKDTSYKVGPFVRMLSSVAIVVQRIFFWREGIALKKLG